MAARKEGVEELTRVCACGLVVGERGSVDGVNVFEGVRDLHQAKASFEGLPHFVRQEPRQEPPRSEGSTTIAPRRLKASLGQRCR